jgi:hypothetical protein
MSEQKPSHVQNAVEGFDFCDSELVIAFVFAVGTDYRPLQAYMERLLLDYDYETNFVRISSLIGKFVDVHLEGSNEIERISAHMDAGNSACNESGRKDLWSLAAIAEINKARSTDKVRALPRRAQPPLFVETT